MKAESYFAYILLPRFDTFSSRISYMEESSLEEVLLQLIAKMRPSGVMTVFVWGENFQATGSYFSIKYYFDIVSYLQISSSRYEYMELVPGLQ